MTTTTSYLKARTCKLCSTFKHVLWALNTQVLQDNSLRTNNEYKVYKYAYIHLWTVTINNNI